MNRDKERNTNPERKKIFEYKICMYISEIIKLIILY